ncbi:ATP-dependent sacrificial sulfur transferase LarE [uncultured Methanobrevibacter sp.]|uniref:ATP-dependent sacrificial sulfur transferase LarE n=1 Tax=uncultured Methanobrevibacter sp. TaxID=253161 RepID=UPI002638352A|nr:ATP-dependent sacrificial sulfur transferase LarE [uncultured Methanobrevibacter sp.]
MNLDEKVKKVKNILKNRKVAIAFSGGADSTLLAYLASKVSDNPIAITIDNHIFPTGFIEHCTNATTKFGIKHKVIDLDFYKNEELLSNKSNRCFVCRDLMYGNIKKYALENDYESVLDGNNISDLVLDRPGILITYKNNIESPFISAKLTSKEIHEYLNKHNIPFSRSTTCLGTRLPTNTKMTKENINQIRVSEDLIYEKTKCEIVKVRNNNGLALCEVDDLTKLLNQDMLNQINYELKEIGFKKVALNLSQIDDDETITLNYKDGGFEYQLPYTINIENTKKQLKDKIISSDYEKIIIKNQIIYENGLIKGNNFKSKEECLNKFMELLPNIRRNI